jgi:hypothetical protein
MVAAVTKLGLRHKSQPELSYTAKGYKGGAPEEHGGPDDRGAEGVHAVEAAHHAFGVRLRLEGLAPALGGVRRIGLAQPRAAAPVEHDVRAADVQQLCYAALERRGEHVAHAVGADLAVQLFKVLEMLFERLGVRGGLQRCGVARCGAYGCGDHPGVDDTRCCALKKRVGEGMRQ